jgi:hypothetical protein
MPRKRSLKLYQLEVLPVELTDDPRIPVILDQGKLLGEIDLMHRVVLRNLTGFTRLTG